MEHEFLDIYLSLSNKEDELNKEAFELISEYYDFGNILPIMPRMANGSFDISKDESDQENDSTMDVASNITETLNNTSQVIFDTASLATNNIKRKLSQAATFIKDSAVKVTHFQTFEN
uniref:RGS domain-containing protein n=1 Tax=Rhabditophanes sp. KR3021 TaxID=114890 RepID=A0AC35TG00_9BILA